MDFLLDDDDDDDEMALGDGKKKVKLTKAEKKELKLKKMEGHERKLRKKELDRQLDLTNIDMSEIRRKVFEQAAAINIPIIREEMMHKWGFFERTIDWKDFYVSQLRDDIFYYEMHQRISEQKHNENVDRIIEIYNEAMGSIMNTYLLERENILKERKKQATRMVLTHNRRLENMQSLCFVMKEQRKAELDKLNWDNTNERQLKLFRYEEAVSRIAQEGNVEITQLWTGIKTIFGKYKVTTKKKRQDYLILKQRDMADKENLEKLSTRMTQLHRQIKQKRLTLSKIKEDEKVKSELATRRLLLESLKHRMRSFSEQSSKQTENFSVMSTGIVKRLTDFSTKMSEAVSLLSICRKLETLEEKVAPKLAIKASLCIHSNSPILPFTDDLEQLWAKTMHVSKMNEDMTLVLNQLKQENSTLNTKLHSVIETMSRMCR